MASPLTGPITDQEKLNDISLLLNKNRDQPDYVKRLAIGAGMSLLSNTTGVTFASTVDQNDNYSTTPFRYMERNKIFEYTDFRSKLGSNTVDSILLARKDGLSASIRGSKLAILYAVASNVPDAGAYSVFNLDAGGRKGYGWGSHGDPNAAIYRLDSTMQSNVVTKYKDDVWKPKILTQAVPFRGDRVTVTDYSKRKLSQVYRWKPPLFGETFATRMENLLGAFNPAMTQDFIKFFLTGPALHNGSEEKDDIIVFRASITSMEDTFSPNWSAVNMIGRADPNYQYAGFERSMNISFDVYATDRDELKPIWRKLNALAGYTAPTYDPNSIGMIAPWMRISIGDLLRQQPVLIDSLSYTLHDQDTTWETNLEDDPEMKQVPRKISVTMQLKVITEYLPEKNGQFYTLSNNDTKHGPVNKTSNWLSDKDNPTTKRAELANLADAAGKMVVNKLGGGLLGPLI